MSPVCGCGWPIDGEYLHGPECEPVKKWDDPSFWERISVGTCSVCKEGHVLKDGLCWTHRPERQS